MCILKTNWLQQESDLVTVIYIYISESSSALKNMLISAFHLKNYDGNGGRAVVTREKTYIFTKHLKYLFSTHLVQEILQKLSPARNI
jgi:hypothetical protein